MIDASEANGIERLYTQKAGGKHTHQVPFGTNREASIQNQPLLCQAGTGAEQRTNRDEVECNAPFTQEPMRKFQMHATEGFVHCKPSDSRVT